MQIIIDISKELKNEIHNHGLFLCPNDKTALVNAIKHGTPLPKGHGRLIDADLLRNQFPIWIDNFSSLVVNNTISKSLTIIEADKERSKE